MKFRLARIFLNKSWNILFYGILNSYLLLSYFMVLTYLEILIYNTITFYWYRLKPRREETWTSSSRNLRTGKPSEPRSKKSTNFSQKCLLLSIPLFNLMAFWLHLSLILFRKKKKKNVLFLFVLKFNVDEQCYIKWRFVIVLPRSHMFQIEKWFSY